MENDAEKAGRVLIEEGGQLGYNVCLSLLCFAESPTEDNTFTDLITALVEYRQAQRIS